jgi:hypothetical protein
VNRESEALVSILYTSRAHHVAMFLLCPRHAIEQPTCATVRWCRVRGEHLHPFVVAATVVGSPRLSIDGHGSRGSSGRIVVVRGRRGGDCRGCSRRWCYRHCERISTEDEIASFKVQDLKQQRESIVSERLTHRESIVSTRLATTGEYGKYTA